MNIEFTILNNHNKLVTIKCSTKPNDNKLYRCGTVISCNCNQKPTPYLLINDEVYCPNCGKKSLTLKKEEDTDNISLDYYGTDYNTMQDLYKLSETVPYTIWNSIADYFVKLTPVDVDFGYPVDYVGWVTSNPFKVKELLPNIIVNDKQEKGFTDFKQTRENISETDNNFSSSELYDFVDQLHAVFSVVETPYGEFDLCKYTGELIRNPCHPPSRYGRGEFWYVCNDSIWFVRLNFRSGDDIRMNNVVLDGELRGIGKVIDFDSDVYDLLCKLKG